jgi:type IV secretory pathway TraG/TraD family ATPase VirD4
MLFTQMFQCLQYCATEKYKHQGQRLPVPVRFILDEFANTCTIPNFVKILAYARSFGIGIVPIFQSLEQIKTMYKDEWGVIIDNCSARLFLGSISHVDTLEYVSKMLGKGTFDKMTSGRTYGSRGSSSHNYDRLGRELMDPAELSKIPKSDCILMISGRKPWYSKKYNYEKHPNYPYTSDASASNNFHYTPAVTTNVSTHREQHSVPQVTTPAVDLAYVKKPVDTDLIKVIDDPKTTLDILSHNMQYFVPVPDGLMPDYGGPKFSEEDVDVLFDILDIRSA